MCTSLYTQQYLPGDLIPCYITILKLHTIPVIHHNNFNPHNQLLSGTCPSALLIFTHIINLIHLCPRDFTSFFFCSSKHSLQPLLLNKPYHYFYCASSSLYQLLYRIIFQSCIALVIRSANSRAAAHTSIITSAIFLLQHLLPCMNIPH